MTYERDNIATLAAYTPGEQPAAGAVIKLNTNENPYPPADAVMAAIRTLPAEALRRYPSPAATLFREVAAGVHGLTPKHVIATNGGDELLRLAVTVFCEPCGEKKADSNSPPSQGGAGGGSDRSSAFSQSSQVESISPTLPQPLPKREGRERQPLPERQGSRKGIGVCEPSYSLYPVLARAHDTPIAAVPLCDDFAIPDDAGERFRDAGVGLVMIVNPHAPSGRLQPLAQLAAIARALAGRAVLLIDEAYVDFAQRDALPLLKDAAFGDLDNVLLLRTLSKGYSLAGLRFGYGLGHPDLIAALDKARDSYNTDAVSQAAAVAALQSRQEASKTWRAVIAERTRLTDALRDRGFGVPPSESNFILARPPATGPNAAAVYESLKARRIFVRYFDQDRLRDRLRITIGTQSQNDALLAALNDLSVA